MVVSGCSVLDFNNSFINPLIKCEGTRNFNTARDRWWFVAISNCNSSKGLQLKYERVTEFLWQYNFPILFQLSIANDEWQTGRPFALSLLSWWILHSAHSYRFFRPKSHPFSSLHLVCRGSKGSSIASCHLQALHLCGVSSGDELKNPRKYVQKLCFYFPQTMGIFLLGTHYMIYAVDGIGNERARLNGRILEASAEILFMLLIVLIAKGYTVTRARLRQASVIKVSSGWLVNKQSFIDLFPWCR